MSWKRMQRDLSSQILSFPVSAGRERRFLIFLVGKPARLIIRLLFNTLNQSTNSETAMMSTFLEN